MAIKSDVQTILSSLPDTSTVVAAAADGNDVDRMVVIVVAFFFFAIAFVPATAATFVVVTACVTLSTLRRSNVRDAFDGFFRFRVVDVLGGVVSSSIFVGDGVTAARTRSLEPCVILLIRASTVSPPSIDDDEEEDKHVKDDEI